MTTQLILASSSPRRAEILTQVGLRFVVRAPSVDEAVRPWEDPEDYVQRMALEKARVRDERALPRLAADTVVVHRGIIFGKPQGREHGLETLSALCGDVHTVLTAVAVWFKGELRMKMSCSRVWLRSSNKEELEAYWRTGEPQDKAGGYGLQGVGGVLVERVEGSPTGIAGLPLCETIQLLREVDVQVWNSRPDGNCT